jgi:hypothetical protein
LLLTSESREAFEQLHEDKTLLFPSTVPLTLTEFTAGFTLIQEILGTVFGSAFFAFHYTLDDQSFTCLVPSLNTSSNRSSLALHNGFCHQS